MRCEMKLNHKSSIIFFNLYENFNLNIKSELLREMTVLLYRQDG